MARALLTSTLIVVGIVLAAASAACGGGASAPSSAVASRTATPLAATATAPLGAQAAATEPAEASSDDGGPSSVGVPQLPPDFTPQRPENPNAQVVGNCVMSVDAVEIFPEEAIARGQRVFEAPGERWYLRADGTCVHLFLGPDLPVPDYAPDHTDGPMPIYD